TLVIVGERDVPWLRASADALEAGIKGARKVVIPGAGHMTNMEAPREVNHLLLEFLAGVR
ncbi:MAG TPA: alpha/beta hydrolase, partial [Chloroflexota bacterium]|nr:alpha/beta hydrolase [Chloroflexota bacterium]